MFRILLLIFFSTTLYAQQDKSLVPSVFVLEDPEKTNVVELDHEDQEEILIAVPKDRQPKRLRMAVQSTEDAHLIVIEDRSRDISMDFYNYRGMYYGGKVELGKKFGFNGNVFFERQYSTLIINHHHEYALYKVNLSTFSIEPLAHQYFRFFQAPGDARPIKDFFIQPSNLGIKLSKEGKKVDSSILFSTGPQIQVIRPTPEMSKILPAFNLKISLTF